MNPGVTIVIQARMGSTRLPGKMLMPLHQGKSLLYWLIERVKQNHSTQSIVVATSHDSQDDPIESECQAIGVACFRGSEWDVLSRFYTAAQTMPNALVMRICGDSPLISGEIIDFAIQQFQERRVDYFSNGNEPPDFAEDGFCVELFYNQDLKVAYENATWMSEREHVTPYIKKNAHLKKAWQQFRKEYRYKLSVDTPEDFTQVAWLFSKMTNPMNSGMDEIMKIIAENPEKINSPIKLNEGYQKSIQEDRKVK
jgi:spore coat polysaccharide biosynthesis protein SpsF (cytidylyltransferase family)